MKFSWLKYIFFVAGLGLSACGPGQVFGPTLTPTSTDTPTATYTPTSTPTPSMTPTPTELPIPFGLRPGMQVEDCYKLTLNVDNTLPVNYLEQERAWVAKNSPRFVDIEMFNGIAHIDGLDPYFPLPGYITSESGLAFGKKGPGQSVVSCETLTDGTLVIDMVIRPYGMADETSVTSENVPILHFALTQAGYDYIIKQPGLINFVAGTLPGSVIASPAKALAILADPANLATLKLFDIWIAAPAGQNAEMQVAAFDPSLHPFAGLMLANDGYHSPLHPDGPGFQSIYADLIDFIGSPYIADRLKIGDRLSDRILPVVGFSFVY
jgi:hypothetical protein